MADQTINPENTRRYPKSGIHGKIVHGLGAEIGAGALATGQRLPAEKDLIQRFGASHTALREAFKVLSSKGLIKARQRAGTRVCDREKWDLLDPDVLSWLTPKSLDDDLVSDLIELREFIEPMAAKFAAQRANSLDLRNIRDAYDRMRSAGKDGEKFFAADLDFHLSVITACHNQLVLRLSGIVETVLGLSFRMQLETYEPESGLLEHFEVYRCIENGDSAGAEKAMGNTIKSGAKNMRRAMTKFAKSAAK